jgi:hypothetical protein
MLLCWACGCASGARGAAPATSSPTTRPDVAIDFRGARNLGNETTDQHGRPFKVQGLSGIAWLGGERFVAVMDNCDKLVRLTIRFNDDGSIASADYAGGVTLSEAHDYEGIGAASDAPDRVFISEEDTPAIHEFSLADGSRVRTLPTPPVFRPPNLRGNLGFESCAARGGDVWTVNEESLKSDGPISTVDAGCVVRLLHYRLGANGEPGKTESYAYVTDPIHKPHSPDDHGLSRNGVSELILLPDGRLMALERSLSVLGPKNIFSDFRNSMYVIDTTGATDVSTGDLASGLIGKTYRAVTKTPVFSNTGLVISNMEGLTVGPKIGPDTWAMVGVVDNNGYAMVANRVIAFSLHIGPARSTQPSPTPSH